jgi:Mg/Co/Ni transporter MgtE
MVHFQRMLRYPPNEPLGALIDASLEPVQASTSAAEVSRILASYNLVSVPVVDDNHRLVGVVTIDDVLDYLLPDDWRSTNDETPVPTSTATLGSPTKQAVRRTSRGTR